MKRENKISKVITILVLVLLGAAVGFMGARFGVLAAETIPANIAIGLAILAIPSFLFVIAFHELGHAFAGIKMNFDFRMLVVGPFMWDKEKEGWKFKWNKNVNVSGGLVICLPKGNERLSQRFSIYAAGGLVASLLLAAIAFASHKLMNQFVTNDVLNLISYLLSMTAFLSLIIFIATVIPVHVGGFSSDGARILRFAKGGEPAAFELLILKMIGLSTAGTRPKLYSRNELEEAMVLAEKINAPFGVYLYAYAHQMAFDDGDIELAENYLLEYTSRADEVPEGMRSAVWMDAAFFYAYAMKDLPRATEYWKKFKPSAILPKAQVLATEAAFAFLRVERELMLNKIEAAMKELPNMMDRGLAVALREKLEKLS